MPVIYSIDAAQGFIRTRCIGQVKLQDVIHHFKALERDPKCPRHLDVLLDLSENESVPDATQVAAVADLLARVRLRIQFGSCAIVAPRDALFGMMRMFEAMAERSFRISCTFRTLAEAEAWLARNRTSSYPADSESDKQRARRHA